ncbi:MAG: Ig-like domain-containing protein [Mucilaginibacter sp.]|uniref:Ig-like domain-containing protein n=1 Tax=Mucilaginibacter sp. TaxID=1882438 RepID=UPI003264D2F5
MSFNKKRVFFVQILLLAIALLVGIGCASIQRPLGGPRDKTPPKLLKATPVNQTKNFAAKTIQLDFDEYFKLANSYQEITISPDMPKAPEYNIKSKSLVIKLKDTLQKNTTYVINFGKAIADVNEGNILKNFTYVFSTGAHIDSLSVSGVVVNPLTQAKEKDVTVMLIPVKLDTAYYRKKKPAIYTTTDSSGVFKMSNLHEGVYKIYALKETNNNKIYDSDDEVIGFTKNLVHLKKDTSDIHLQLFKQVPEKLRPIERRIDQDGKLYFLFNKPIPNASVRILNDQLDAQKIVEFSKQADTATIYLKSMVFDSIKVSFLSNNVPLDTITLRRSQKDTYKRKILLDYNLSNDKLKPGSELQLKTNYPIASIDPGRITMTEDSVDVSETDFSIQRNPEDAKRFTLKYKWKPGRLYSIGFNEGSFIDIYGGKNARIVKKFDLDKPENYGKLILNVTVPDTGQYVVQLLNSNDVEVHSDIISKNTKLVYDNYSTTKYRIKVIYDTNHNGKWDTGNVKQGIQPENIWLFKKDIPLRYNFDVSQDIEIPKETKYP